MKSEQLNSYVEVKQTTSKDIRQLGPLVSDRYKVDSTLGQTVINLPFSITQTTEGKNAFLLIIDGKVLFEGATDDFTFTNIVGNTSAQVTLNSPLSSSIVVGIQALKLGSYIESFPNPSSVQASLNNDVAQPHKMAQAAFQPFVQKTFVTAPNTQIINRAQVEAGALKAIGGIERLSCRGISVLKTEFGPLGEPVFELDSKDSRVRFVGYSWVSLNNQGGNRIERNDTTITTDFVEVTFYGTGLNLLTRTNSGARTAGVSIDGGSEATITLVSSGVLDGRNYNTNEVWTLTTTLSLGWHTVKIRNSSSNGISFYGFEILNQRTDLGVLSGLAYIGAKQDSLSTFSTSAYNAGVVGTRGARVVKYLLNGAISQSVQEVNPSAGYLTSADFTNEEIVRRIFCREFGVQRADDISTLTSAASTRAFTLDDGTTTLMGLNLKVENSAFLSTDCLRLNAGTSNFVSITFVGTGLSLLTVSDAISRSVSVTIDNLGVVGTLTINTATSQLSKVVSGLPYGTHTVKLTNLSGSGDSFGITDFIIYQPKKPSTPAGAIEVSDYNVLANYIMSPSAAYLGVPQGVHRKQLSCREATYVGTWIALSVDLTSGGGVFDSGINTATLTSGAYVEYSFFGTGFEFRGNLQTGANNVSVLVDGASNLSGFTTNFAQVSTGATFTASTGAIGGSSAAFNKVRLQVTGLTLGFHKVRFTTNNTTQFNMDCLDILTPIHINYPTLKLGSQSLKDTRVFSPIIDKPEKIDLSKPKALVLYDGTNQKILSGFNVAAVLRLSTGDYIVYFEKPFKDTNFITTVGGDISEIFIQQPASSGVQYKNKGMQRLLIRNSSNTPADSTLGLVFFGELEDEGEI